MRQADDLLCISPWAFLEAARNLYAQELNTTEKDDEVSLLDGFIRQMMSRQVKASTTPRKDEAERSILLLKVTALVPVFYGLSCPLIPVRFIRRLFISLQ